MAKVYPEHAVPHWQVAIIGAGPGGLGLAIRLVKSRRRDFVVFEASDGVGGTWRTNTYPGAACDVPSHLYSYSFALKPDWTKTYAAQPEILQYFEDCADRFGIRPHLRPNTRITAARWDEGRRRWCLTDAQGAAYEADVLVSAIGTFTAPALPDIEGLASFTGPCFHSARWEHEHDLKGRRVAVIGTGASAAQIIPEVAKSAQEVYVFQRTPQWILPRSDKPFTEKQKRRFARNPMLDPASPPRDLLGVREHDRLPPRRGGGRATQGPSRSATSTTGSRTTSCGPSSPRTTRSAASARWSAATSTRHCCATTSSS